MAEVTLFELRAVLGVSFANTSDFSMLLCKTTLEFTPILLHSDSHVDEILTISSSKIIQNPYSNTNK